LIIIYFFSASSAQDSVAKTNDSANKASSKSQTVSDHTYKKTSVTNTNNVKIKPAQPNNNNIVNNTTKTSGDIKTETKSKYGGNSVKNVSSDDSNGDAPPTKKSRMQYVDAVERLETSTSVHVPKKLVLAVGNLPEDITKEQIIEHFKRTGLISNEISLLGYIRKIEIIVW